jgi:hypothetical protein
LPFSYSAQRGCVHRYDDLGRHGLGEAGRLSRGTDLFGSGRVSANIRSFRFRDHTLEKIADPLKVSFSPPIACGR